MATVRLGRYELEEYDLPKVCLRCGARASHYKTKKFQWFPPWAWFVLGWIGAMLFMKKVTMQVPLCEKHRWHWIWPPLIGLGGLALIVGLLFVGVALGAERNAPPWIVFGPVLVLLLSWFVGIVFVAATTIRPREITDKSITLRGVSPEFIAALEKERRGDEDRPRRGRSRFEDDEEEDDRPRAQRRPARHRDDDAYYDPDRRRRIRRDKDDD